MKVYNWLHCRRNGQENIKSVLKPNESVHLLIGPGDFSEKRCTGNWKTIPIAETTQDWEQKPLM
jgi:hypothetical protein